MCINQFRSIWMLIDLFIIYYKDPHYYVHQTIHWTSIAYYSIYFVQCDRIQLIIASFGMMIATISIMDMTGIWLFPLSSVLHAVYQIDVRGQRMAWPSSIATNCCSIQCCCSSGTRQLIWPFAHSRNHDAWPACLFLPWKKVNLKGKSDTAGGRKINKMGGKRVVTVPYRARQALSNGDTIHSRLPSRLIAISTDSPMHTQLIHASDDDWWFGQSQIADWMRHRTSKSVHAHMQTCSRIAPPPRAQQFDAQCAFVAGITAN